MTDGRAAVQFDVTLTVEDYREAFAPPEMPRNSIHRVPPWLDGLTYPLLLLMIVPAAFPGHGIFGLPDAGRRVEGPRQNLWLTLAPMLCVTTWLLVVTVVNRWFGGGQHLATVPGDPVARRRRIANRLMIGQLLAVAWMALPLAAGLRLSWTPTDGEVLCAAISPWLLYVSVARLVDRNPSARVAGLLWKASRSAGRPGSVVVSADAVASDDGVIALRYRWPYFVRYRETSNLLLLVTEDGGLLILPKRAVATVPGGEAELRSLVQTHVPTGTFLPRESRFPVVAPRGRT